VNWRFVEAQHRYQQDPDNEASLGRDPSFVDPVWQQRIRDRLMTIVREEKRYDPLYYCLGDETGIADLSAFWDFDLSPGSLAAMRVWLRQNYGSLAALNGEWGTRFSRWDLVRPETTRRAMRRTDDNFAAWADFKAWMDVSFARAMRMGTDAVHRADPAALSGIEGVQVPGWGGYDYSLLVHTVDAMELADLPLAHSLNPHLTMLSTSFSAAPQDLHNIWRGLLEGGQGLILWDEDYSIVRQDATLGQRGKDYAATFAEIRGPLGKLLLASEPHVDPIAILYSPASFRTQWMLEQKPKGDAWMTRDAETEIGNNAARDAMWAYAQAVTHLGLQPSYLSPAMLAHGALRERGIRTLILPHAIA
ncbi:MAG TPA: beta-galactosidase, partial [Ktedonobacterales bacterium]|nr:beta-galactosidase [Ktedonobacterales bacterium]